MRGRRMESRAAAEAAGFRSVREIGWGVDVSLERAFRRTQWESNAAGGAHDGVHRKNVVAGGEH